MKFWKILLLFFCLELKSLYSEITLDWIDIPRDDYQIILAAKEIEIEHLNRLIECYHAIDKSSLKSQTYRIESLKEISDYLEFLSKEEKFSNQKLTIFLLNKAVQNKKAYLNQLLMIPSDETIIDYHLDDSLLSDRKFQPIFLRNNISYSLKMKEFWGSFWLESIDPCHRRLANYYQFWLDSQPVIQNYQSFFLWLESQLIPKNTPVVDYYSDTQLKLCHFEWIDGYLRNSETYELLNTDPSKRNLFIIDLVKELYLETGKEGVWHTSLSHGKPVLGAGLLQVEQGIIKTIAFESGHYLPSIEQNFQCLQIIREKGARFKKPLELIYFENRNKYTILLSEDHLEEYQNFYEAIHETSKRELISSNEF